MMISVASWNVLADSYASPRTHTACPVHYLRWSCRGTFLFAKVGELDADILCLQEVDHIDEWTTVLEAYGYGMAWKRRSGRQDGVVVAWKRDRFALLRSEGVDFDDLAAAVGGGETRLLRQNVGLICVLQSTCEEEELSSRFIIANTHLYWNPDAEDVKLLQAQMLLDRVAGVQRELAESLAMLDDVLTAGEPGAAAAASAPATIICGDMNSLPSSSVYELLASGRTKIPYGLRGGGGGSGGPGGECEESRFLCDMSLNRLTRWLRVVGVDCALETDEQERVRVGGVGSAIPLFDHARAEERVLLTTSASLIRRRNCPPALLIDCKHLEASFRNLIERFQVKLEPGRFFTICVKCNGAILPVAAEDADAVAAAEESVPCDLPLFRCSLCRQFYWWDDRPNTSAVRAKQLAERLFALVTPAAADAEGAPHRLGDPRFVVAKTARFTIVKPAAAVPSSATDATAAPGPFGCTPRPRSAPPATPIGTIGGEFRHDLDLASAYASRSGEEPLATNYTPSFRGTIDYIFHNSRWSTGSLLMLPRPSDMEPIPSAAYPSDHLALMAELVLLQAPPR